MSKPPVFYALMQVVFNPVSQIGRYVPEFQEQLRRSGFPDYKPEAQNEVRISFGPGGAGQQTEQVTSQRWRFLNMEGTEGFTLVENALVYHTNEYDSFSHCKKSMVHALTSLHEILDLSFVQRIGMRYLDAIGASGEASLEKLVKPGLLGVHDQLSGDLEHTFLETRKSVQGGGLVLRSLINDKGLSIPPDLSNQTLRLPQHFRAHKGAVLLLDTDYFLQQRYTFDIDKVTDQFDQAHAILLDTFKKVITEEAKQLWNL